MKNKSRILWITQTAVFLAMLIVLQAATTSLGNTIITGAIVNMLLILSVMLCGLSSGLTVSFLSPVLAKFFGIGPLWSIIPLIIIGNMVLVVIWHSIGNKTGYQRVAACLLALITASVAKFLVLYLGIVKLAVPFLLHLPKQQAGVISGMFSIPQLVTAVVGGAAAAALLPALHRFLKYKGTGLNLN